MQDVNAATGAQKVVLERYPVQGSNPASGEIVESGCAAPLCIQFGLSYFGDQPS
jgi:hypothetical protein